MNPEWAGKIINPSGWGLLYTDKLPKMEIYFGKRTLAHSETSTWCRVDVSDTHHGSVEDVKERTIPKFIAAADAIDRELRFYGRATIHCVNGNSRTSFCLITYLIRYAAATFDEASALIVEVQSGREDITFELGKVFKGGASYSKWIQESIGKIQNTGNSGDSLAEHTQYAHAEGKLVVEVVKNKVTKRKPKTKERIDTLETARFEELWREIDAMEDGAVEALHRMRNEGVVIFTNADVGVLPK
ncbi:hypothetical protein HDC36_003376 [Xanthomonas sp. JAI131]|uniref:dual specificity protein phosphatase family protein n=1 Tax=Xanthomonas sp. JAI131 TaxID=2723067 RepID=UPI0015C743EB|nr:dual specificity protein phosphatase family protein [Xanthomonas sp. JAI131]NYF21900.1 hypothetical protein [Xanthomonas sp. JAI131]